MSSKLKNIVSKQKKSTVLELKAADKYSGEKIVDALYNLNFNNWRSSKKVSVSYSEVGDVYIFVK